MTDTNYEPELANPELIQWSPKRGPTFGDTPLLRISFEPSLIRPGAAAGGVAIGASAAGALAIGALAVGALAIGAVAIGRLAVGRASFKDVRIGRLVVDELIVRRKSDEA